MKKKKYKITAEFSISPKYEKDFIEIANLCIEISKMISKFITYLNKTS